MRLRPMGNYRLINVGLLPQGSNHRPPVPQPEGLVEQPADFQAVDDRTQPRSRNRGGQLGIALRKAAFRLLVLVLVPMLTLL
jgi:hypothetical protein